MKQLLGEETFDYSTRRVLITGAAGGLGSAIAAGFASHRATVMLADRNTEGLEALANTLPNATTYGYEQTDLESLKTLAEAVGVVDILVNNAGILTTGPLLDTAPETMATVVQTNLTGPMVLARHIGAAMVVRGSGVIINVSSQLAFHGAATRAVYSATKAGIAQFTRASAAEWAPHGVRVLGVAPGRSLTPMTEAFYQEPGALETALAHIPAGRLGTPDDVARLVLYLASENASYIVGETVIADGGYVLL